MKKIYKSPPEILAAFFENSRDRWKTRCRENQDYIQYQRIRIRDLEISREEWKQRYKEMERRCQRLEQQLAEEPHCPK